MPEGATWELYIPSELAYGDRGAGASIPGGSALIFILELIEIQGTLSGDEEELMEKLKESGSIAGGGPRSKFRGVDVPCIA